MTAFQQNPQQPGYQQPAAYPQQQVIIQGGGTTTEDVTTIGNWIVFMLLTSIPIVNIIMLFVYAFSNSKPSRANLAKLQLLLLAIIIGIFLLAGIVMLCLSFFGSIQ